MQDTQLLVYYIILQTLGSHLQHIGLLAASATLTCLFSCNQSKKCNPNIIMLDTRLQILH